MGGSEFRETIAVAFGLGLTTWDCPHGKAWGYKMAIPSGTRKGCRGCGKSTRQIADEVAEKQMTTEAW